MTKTIPWTTTDIIKATKGKLLYGEADHNFSGISIDSRSITVNDIFVAIQGQVHDGHNFTEDVIRRGIRGFLIKKDKTGDFPNAEWEKRGLVCVAVNDTTIALGDLAAYNRRRSNVSVIAITGSNGKTTTKDMTAAVVSRRFNTLATSGNFNNEIGLPLTLLKLNHRHQWAVLELGMNKPGEIGRLGQICLPDVGVIINIGHAHLEGFDSVDGIMHAKGELLAKIKPGGTAVLNGDDPKILQLADKSSTDVLFYGLSENAAVRALAISEKSFGVSFTLSLPSEQISIDLNTPGNFMVSNALAAASAGYLLGSTAEEIKAGLEDFKPVQGRMNILTTNNGIHIINDTYNANPGSMEAAITTLKSLKGRKRGVLVIGDMLELGKYAASMHKKVGSLAARSDITKLYVTGEFADTVAAGARDEDMDSRDIFRGTREEILKDLTDHVRPGDWVLVKGSRAMGMEKIVEGLTSEQLL